VADLDPEMVRQRLGELHDADALIRNDLMNAAHELRDELRGLSTTVREVRDALLTEVAESTSRVELAEARRLDDHETRIRAIERRLWMGLGVLSLAAFAIPMIERWLLR